MAPMIVNDVIDTISDLIFESQTGIFAMEEFYPVVNGIAFDDCQTAWWYCQEILGGCHKDQCTYAGLEDRFQRLLKIYNRHHWEYIGGKKKYQYCTVTLSFALKDDENN